MKSKIDSLTGLKGIFCFVIVAFHTYDMRAIGEFMIFPYIATWGGTLGNSFFFMISGFLIVYNYREKIVSGRVKFPAFIFKRLVKLYPLYLFSNMVALFRRLYISGLESFDLKEFIYVVFMQAGGTLKEFTPYNTVCWFSSTLMMCYCLYFGIIYLSKNIKINYIIMTIIVVIWGYILIINEWNFPYAYRKSGEAFINFFVGVLVMELMSKIEEESKQIINILVFTLIFLLLLCNNGRIGMETLITFIICPIVIYLGVTSNLCKVILTSRLLFFLGTISTSIYFWHNLIWKMYSPLFTYTGLFKDITKYALYLAVLVICSYLSNSGIEKKVDKWYRNKICRE